MTESMLQHALNYASQGLAVFPCKAKSKIPNTKHGCKDATTDTAQIKQWWTDTPDANIAIATGEESGGLVVVDLDMHGDKRGFEYIKDWEKKNGALKPTWISKTGSGGRHFLYKSKNDKIKNSTNSELCIDIRARGGYIIAPPSIHPTGTSYEWVYCEGDIAEADENVYKLISTVSKNRALQRSFVVSDKEITQGGRNETLFKLACRYQGQGLDDNTIFELVWNMNNTKCSPPLDEAEVKKLVNSALSEYEKGTPSNGFERNSRQEVLDTLSNLTKILEVDTRFSGRFYYDERAYRNKVKLPLPWDKGTGERTLQDIDYAQFRLMLENLKNPLNEGEILQMKAKEKNIVDAIATVSYDHHQNPLVNWLDSLEWDGVERLDTALTDFLGVEDSSDTRAIMHLIAMGAVARAYHAGTQFDYMPVLVGAQGIGKSQFVKRLCPKEEWYLDNLATMEGDQAIEKIENKWIVEVAELANLRKDKIESVKAFITQTQDTYRPKYARNTENRKRSTIFIGTTNSTTFLSDKTGNRRWIPLHCGVVKPTKSLWEGATTKHYFEQMWAEAVSVYKSEEVSLVLDREVEERMNLTREEFSSEDPRQGMIEEYLDTVLDAYTRQTKGQGDLNGLKICLKQIAVEALGIDDDRTYYFNDLKMLMDRLPLWQWHGEKRCKCGKYGSQRFYTPKKLMTLNEIEQNEMTTDQQRAMEIVEQELSNTEGKTAEDLLLKIAMRRPSALVEVYEGD